MRREIVALVAGFLIAASLATAQTTQQSSAGGGVGTVTGTAGEITVTPSSGVGDVVLSLPNPLTPPGTLAMGANAITFTDATLIRGAANRLDFRNGTNAQALRIYNTFTSEANNERATIGWASNIFQIHTGASGGGTVRPFQFGTGSALYWGVDTNGHFMAVTDNQNDIGALAATRPRNVYAGTGFGAAGSAGLTGTISVRKGDDSGACTVTITGGLITAEDC